MIDASTLKTVVILSDLTKQQLDDVGRHFTPVHLDKGSFLFYRNDKSTGLYLVIQGSLQIIIDNDDNKEIIVYTIEQDDIVGEMTIFTEAERSATAIALAECRLLKINNSKFIELMNLYPTIAVNLTRTLIERLQAANGMIERLGMMDGAERVVHFLKAMIMREGQQGDEWYVLARKPTYRQISQRLGVSEKTVYRTMHSLVKAGDVDIKGRRLYVRRGLIDSLH